MASSFADGARLSKKISSCDDVFVLQEDLAAVIKCKTKNNMVLHESNIQYLAYRSASSKVIEESSLLFSEFSIPLHQAKVWSQ